MKGILAVAAREIAERKLLFPGALVAGLIPLGFPLLPVLRGNARDARSAAVLLLAITISVAFPLVLGATIFVSDIAQKRLGFYFSRPLPGISIWAGKLLGALLITLGCAFLAAAPVLFLDGKSAFSAASVALDTPGPLVPALLGILLLLLLAHVVASMARLRSAWVVLDFFLAVLFAVAITLCIRRLLLTGLWGLEEMRQSPERLFSWLTAALIVIFLAASCVQVADGRTDARRSHGALSATLWGLTAIFTAVLGGLAWRAGSARAADLARVEPGVLMAPRGPWVAVPSGAFVRLDPATGRQEVLLGGRR